MMSEEETLRNFRGQILDDPGMILEDRDVMSALIKPSREDRKVVDLRGVMVDRLEERLDRLEDTHRNVVAAAYENLAGTNQIHRAVLAILDPTNFDDFLSALGSEVAANLSIDVIRLCLESPSSRNGQPLGPPGPFRNLVIGLQPGGCDHYISDSRQTTTRKITLAPVLAQVGDHLWRRRQLGSVRSSDQARHGSGQKACNAGFRFGRSASLPSRPGHRPAQFLRIGL